jgi:hypothetical protein
MNNIEEFRKVYYECIKQLIDANIDFLNKTFTAELSFKSELEVALYICAYFNNQNLNNTKLDNDKIIEGTMFEILRWMFSQKLYDFSDEYFKERLSEFKFDINSCEFNKYALPIYSYYSIFKSPLKQFELEKVNDFDVIELSKFKYVMFQSLSDMNKKSSEYLYTRLSGILNQS